MKNGCRQTCEGIYDQCLTIVSDIPEQFVCLYMVMGCRNKCKRFAAWGDKKKVTPTKTLKIPTHYKKNVSLAKKLKRQL